MRTRRRFGKAAFLAVPVLGVAAFVGLIGPWPLDDDPQPALRQEAKARAAKETEILARSGPPAPLTAGWAVEPFALEPGIPLAGYGKRRGAPATGAGEPLAARALSLESGGTGAVVVMADLLLVNAALAKEVRHQVERALAPDPAPLLLFTATHTHSGPGAWGEMLAEELSVAGPYDVRVFRRLAEALARAAVAAWKTRGPAEIAFQRTEASELLRNRTVPGGAVDGSLEVVAVRRQDSGALGVIVIFGGHATCLGADNMTFSRDYPGFLIDALETRPGVAFAGFAAGCVGSHACQAPGAGRDKARYVGETLAARAAELMDNAVFRDAVQLQAARVEVNPPPLQMRVGEDWKISPWLSAQMHDGTAEFEILKIDEQIWITLPVELSGLMSAGLRAQAGKNGSVLTLTCFNGDYLGYVLPDALYPNEKLYEARMNFLGPHGGAFIQETLEAMLPEGGL